MDPPSIARGPQQPGSPSSRNGWNDRQSIVSDASGRSYDSSSSRVARQHRYQHPDDDRSFFFSRTQMNPNNEGASFHESTRSEREDVTSRRPIRPTKLSCTDSSNSIRSRMVRGHVSSTEAFNALEIDGMSVMSVVVEDSNIAFCCYNEDRNEILIETCHCNGYETQDLVERFIEISQPTLVLVGTRIINNAPLLQAVTKAPSKSSSGEERHDTDREATVTKGLSPTTSSIPYRVMKSGSYDLRNCRAIILQKLRVTALSKEQDVDRRSTEQRYQDAHPSRHFPSASTMEGPTAFEPSRFHYLATVIDFDSKVLLKALGSLLSYLEMSVFQLTGGIIRINRIVEAKISDCMRISSTTFSALHIFAEETHPLIGKKQGNSKEGFSLYSLLDRTCSKGGQNLLRRWMLKPLNNTEAINTRLDSIDLFLHPSLQTTVGCLASLLKRVGPVDSIIIRMTKFTSKPKDILTLNSSLHAMISLGNILRNDILAIMQSTSTLSTRLCFDYFSKLLQDFNQNAIERLRDRINSVVDEEATMLQDLQAETVAIRYGFNEQLDAWRDQFENLENTLSEAGRALLLECPQLNGLRVIFLPQIGFLVILSQELVNHAQVQLPPDFEPIFDEDDNSFFKCTKMRVLDEEVGDLDGFIKDTEAMILSDLEENILDFCNELQECSSAISTLDCLLSLKECAASLSFTRPQIIDTDPNDTQSRHHVIYAKEVRHPLLEVISDLDIVPNDIRIDEKDRVVVVTGPNYSGKSCYLRQVGLLVYMAHIGSFVPASQAAISITDQIFARFSSYETWSRPQSGFQQECTEIASVFQKATPKSLVLLDEVGKGTHPASGIAILGATLKKLSKIGCKTVCSTHFLELFSMDILRDSEDGIRARRMTILLPDENDEADSVVPLFKLEDGVATSSAGLACAKYAGIENAVIERARAIIQAMRKNEAITPLPELTGEPSFSKEEIDLLLHFSSIENWEAASDGALRLLIQKVSKFES